MEKVDLYGIEDPDNSNIDAGLVTWWTLRGSTSIESLSSAWEDNKLDPSFKPESYGSGTALWRAVTSGIFSKYRDETLIVRKLPHERSAWAVIKERIRGRRESADLSYETLMRIWLDEDENPVFHQTNEIQLDIALFQDDQEYDVWFNDCSEQVLQAFEYNLEHLDAREMSNWLVDLLGNYIHGIRLRSRGGIYYVPPETRDRWLGIIEIIDGIVSVDDAGKKSGTSHTIYSMPVLKSDHVTQAVLDALSEEVTSCVSKIEDSLEAGIKAVAIKNRKTKALALDKKLGAYRSLLGSCVDLLDTKIQDLKASISELEFANDEE